jgi:hypothetical protein
MADKFRTTFTIPVTFAEGEQPTSKKLNSVSTQAKTGLAIVERAIGDLWNQSGDSLTSDYPTHITNLARAVGDQALLNAQLPLPDFTGTTSVKIRQTVTRLTSEISLDFIPVNDSTLQTSIQALHGQGGAFTGTSVARDAVTSDTLWHLDTIKSKVLLGSAIHTSNGLGYIEYNVLAADFPSDAASSSSFSFIPHQSQADWNGLKISQVSAGKYTIVLPFRRIVGSAAKLPSASGNVATSGSITNYYGPDAGYTPVAGITLNRFYRYTLSEPVVGMFTSPVAGTTIPSGQLYLWDNTTDTIIEGVTFKVPDVSPNLASLGAAQKPFMIQAEGSTLDALFSGYTSAMTTDAEADYQSRFAIICVGSSLASAVNELRKELAEGDKLTGFQKKTSHRDLTETQPLVGTRHPFNFPSSFSDNDDHPHLLSRMGSFNSATTTLHRDRFNNGFLGDLLMLNYYSTNNYQHLTAGTPSSSIYFGSHSSISPRIQAAFGMHTVAPAGVAQNGLYIIGSTLTLNTGIIKHGLGYTNHVNDSDFGFFGASGAAAGTVWSKRLLLNATTQTLATFNGTINGSTYIDINANGGINNIHTYGTNLNITSDSGATRFVNIGGAASPNTQLRAYNEVIAFGPGILDFIAHNGATGEYGFFESASSDDASIKSKNTCKAYARIYHSGSTPISVTYAFGVTSIAPNAGTPGRYIVQLSHTFAHPPIVIITGENYESEGPVIFMTRSLAVSSFEIEAYRVTQSGGTSLTGQTLTGPLHGRQQSVVNSSTFAFSFVVYGT